MEHKGQESRRRSDAAEGANWEEIPAWADGISADEMRRVADALENKGGGDGEPDGGLYASPRVGMDESGETRERDEHNGGEKAAGEYIEKRRLEGRDDDEWGGQRQETRSQRGEEREGEHMERKRLANEDKNIESGRDDEVGTEGRGTPEEEPYRSQERMTGHRGARPDPNGELENGVIRENTEGLRRSDLRGHGEDKTSHHRGDSRADALARENMELRQQIKQQGAKLDEYGSKIERIMREPTADERDQLSQARSRADGVYAMLGKQVNEPLFGESPIAYRKRLASGLQQFSDQFKDVALDSLNGAVFNKIEEQIYSDAVTASKTTQAAPRGVLRPHTYNSKGREITEYYGDSIACWGPFMAPGTVASVNRPQNTH